MIGSKVRRKLILFQLLFCFWWGSHLFAQSQDAIGSEYYFPQVADGYYPGGGYSTSFTISNPFSSTQNNVTIFFFQQNGSAWNVDLVSQDRKDLNTRASKKTFTLSGGESLEVFTAGAGSLAVGWALVQSDYPVVASAVFQVFNRQNQVVSEGGVLPCVLNTEFTFYTTYSKDEPAIGTNIDTGFAVINPGLFQARITAYLFNQQGVAVAQGSVILEAKSQTAIFVSQVFKNYSFGASFHGKVRLSANVNIATVAIRQTFGASNTLSTVAVEPESKLNYTVMYDREPNGTKDNAQPIMALPAEIVGTLVGPGDPDAKGDVDVYSVYVNAGQTLYVLMIHDYLSANCPLYADILLHDSQYRTVASLNDEYRGLRNPLTYRALTSGVYYIDIGCLKLIDGTSTCGRKSSYRIHVMARSD